MPIYPSSNYNDLMTQSQLVINNVTDFRERTINDVVNITTGETTLNYPSLTLYDLVDDTIRGEGYITAMAAAMSVIMSASNLTPKQVNYLCKEKQIKIMYLIELARKMAFDIRKLSAEFVNVQNVSADNIYNTDEPLLPSSQSIRSHLGQ